MIHGYSYKFWLALQHIRLRPDVEKNPLLPVVVAVSVHPGPDDTGRVAADHPHRVAGILRVDQLAGVAAAPWWHTAALLRSSTSIHPSGRRRRRHMDDRHRAAAGTTRPRLPSRQCCRTPSPSCTLHNPVLDQHRLLVHFRLNRKCKTVQTCKLRCQSVHKFVELTTVPTLAAMFVRNQILRRTIVVSRNAVRVVCRPSLHTSRWRKLLDALWTTDDDDATPASAIWRQQRFLQQYLARRADSWRESPYSRRLASRRFFSPAAESRARSEFANVAPRAVR